MHDRAADNSGPAALLSMLEVGWERAGVWGQQDLAAMLRHQMSAPLPAAAGGAGSGAARASDSSAERARPVQTFGELLHHPSPPAELLAAVKDFAKAARLDPDAALPKEIAAVIYFAAIVVARRRCERAISRLSDEELRAGVDWALDQPWLEAPTRDIFEREGRNC